MDTVSITRPAFCFPQEKHPAATGRYLNQRMQWTAGLPWPPGQYYHGIFVYIQTAYEEDSQGDLPEKAKEVIVTKLGKTFIVSGYNSGKIFYQKPF